MGGIFRQVDENGQVTFSDRPTVGASQAEALTPQGRRKDPAAAHEAVKKYIQDTQKYVPKLKDYLEYIEFLRSYSPSRHRMMLEALQREDPEAYLKLLKYPQFRPLHEAALGLKAGEKHLTAGVGLATGKFTGSIEKWFETTVQDMMKQQRWGAYADVLGEEAARAGTAASRAAIRTGVASSLSRVGGTVLGGLVDMLDPDKAVSIGAETLRRKAQGLFEKGVIDEMQWSECQTLLSQGKYIAMQQLMDQAVAQYTRGNSP